MSLADEIRAFRAGIIAHDAKTAGRLTSAYGAAFRRIDDELGKLTARIEKARERGEPVTANMLYRERRLERLRAMTLGELSRFGERAGAVIGGAVDTAASQGRAGALVLVDTTTPLGLSPIAPPTLPAGAVESATAAFRSRVVQDLLAPLGQLTARKIEEEIVGGLALGRNPRVVARRVREQLGGNLVRALTISRTEMMRAHRQSAGESYRSNAYVLRGWTWVAGLGSRTCASCWAQHGSVHPLDEQMASHPNCRCVMVPLSRSWSDLGFPGSDEPAAITPGPQRFARAPERVQLAVLGPSKLDAYRRGQVRLGDFVAWRDDPRWGPSTRAAGLAEARVNAAARGQAQAA